MTETFLDGRVTLHCGDCLDVLPTLAPDSFDSFVSDPPYELKFMGKGWDGTGVAFNVETWRRVYRALKPGAHLLAFGGTRTYHRMACAIEDAGFQIRDQLQWLYGSGFPKSLSVEKALDTRTDDEIDAGVPLGPVAAQWSGFGTALKPACEPIVLARKPLIGTVAENVLKHGTGALNIDGCRVATDESTVRADCAQMFSKGGKRDDTGRPALNRSPTGSDIGRWPANVIHDGSDEVVGAFPETSSGASCVVRASGADRDGNTSAAYGKESRPAGTQMIAHGDSGSAARFFYTAKADADDRLGSKHPTVKPVDLKQYLCRLVTPPGGTILDCFAGTGTTGEAAWREGFRAILIEREAEYQADIRRRMALCLAGPQERKRESAKARNKNRGDDHGPLFADVAI